MLDLLATCLVSRRRLLTGLSFVAILVAVLLLVRVFGMTADSSVQENIKLVRAEIGLLVFTIAGLSIELGRRAYLRRTHMDLERAQPAQILTGNV